MIAVSVDENYLNGDALFDYGGREFGVRAWLLLRPSSSSPPGTPMVPTRWPGWSTSIGWRSSAIRAGARRPPSPPCWSPAATRSRGCLRRRADSASFAGSRDPMLRDRTVIGDASLYLAWSGPASLHVPLEAVADRIDPTGRLTISLGLATEAAAEPDDPLDPLDPLLVLRDAAGTAAELRLADVSPMRPLLPARLWKLDVLGERYMPAEKIAWPAERFLQTHAIDLARFTDAAPGLDLGTLVSVSIEFDGRGSVDRDDIGFEPG